MRSWQHSGFNVFLGDEIPTDDTEHLLFLARYLKRSPIALKRLSVIDNNPEPVVRVIKSTDKPEIFRDFSPLDFLAELTQHIPDTFEQTTRYFGAYFVRSSQQNHKIYLRKFSPTQGFQSKPNSNQLKANSIPSPNNITQSLFAQNCRENSYFR